MRRCIFICMYAISRLQFSTNGKSGKIEVRARFELGTFCFLGTRFNKSKILV